MVRYFWAIIIGKVSEPFSRKHEEKISNMTVTLPKSSAKVDSSETWTRTFGTPVHRSTYWAIQSIAGIRGQFAHFIQLLDENWQVRVCMRVSSTLMSWSNENKSCMRVDKREFAWEFHQLSCPGQTRTRVVWELTSVATFKVLTLAHLETAKNSHATLVLVWPGHESWWNSCKLSLVNSHATLVLVWPGTWELMKLSCKLSLVNSHATLVLV